MNARVDCRVDCPKTHALSVKWNLLRLRRFRALTPARIAHRGHSTSERFVILISPERQEHVLVDMHPPDRGVPVQVWVRCPSVSCPMDDAACLVALRDSVAQMNAGTLAPIYPTWLERGGHA